MDAQTAYRSLLSVDDLKELTFGRVLRRCQRAPVCAALDVGVARHLYELLQPLLQRVPPVRLSEEERGRLTALSAFYSIALCQRTGRAIQQDPLLFPEDDQHGQALEARARRAVILQGVSAMLAELKRRVDDLILLDLGSGTSDAIAIHRAVRDDAAEPGASVAARWRYLRLAGPRRYLEDSGRLAPLAKGSAGRRHRARGPLHSGASISAILRRLEATLGG